MSKAPAPVKEKRTWKERFSDYVTNDGPKAAFIFVWVLGNFAVIFSEYYIWAVPNSIAPHNEAVFGFLGHGVAVARSCASGIKLNSALLLLTVLRNFLSWLRGTFVGTYLPLDKNIIFHRYIAAVVAVLTAFHMGAHFVNYKNISSAKTIADLKVLGYPSSGSVPTAFQLAFTSTPGATGHIVAIVMVLMYSSAIKYIRGPMFNVFWFTHHLFVVYFIMLCFHGYPGVLETPTFWCWAIGPMALYALERTMRVCRGNQDTILQLAVAHPSKVLELQMKKPSFLYKPGQYLFLNCPYIAEYEWHPFTITSAPEEDYVSVHIRIVGDWTGDLWNFLNPNKKLGVVQENLISAPDGKSIFRIDGPYGAASEEVFGFKTVVLAAAGIGVTPFGSILKSIRYKIEMAGQSQITKVYFYWISRDKNSFEWFSEVLAALEHENLNNFLEIHTYLTGNLSVDEIRNVMYGMDEEADQITGLQSPTHFGRPNWTQIFDELAVKHAGTDVAVFFCGPRVLSKELYRQCVKHTSTKLKTKFIYHKENF
eukprot:TRINITY_DN7336_c0_g1_i1.p1 TRINITY_DN7336_c0_g1~~TRINITY_DN7336_c0_g1_i1.p1  ORF type:complete len:537 (-),score=59.52 TRINITY_DN7336_c0_g1_i1:3-1613(-)